MKKNNTEERTLSIDFNVYRSTSGDLMQAIAVYYTTEEYRLNEENKLSNLQVTTLEKINALRGTNLTQKELDSLERREGDGYIDALSRDINLDSDDQFDIDARKRLDAFGKK